MIKGRIIDAPHRISPGVLPVRLQGGRIWLQSETGERDDGHLYAAHERCRIDRNNV